MSLCTVTQAYIPAEPAFNQAPKKKGISGKYSRLIFQPEQVESPNHIFFSFFISFSGESFFRSGMRLNQAVRLPSLAVDPLSSVIDMTCLVL
jgi:hypothetical protein